MKNGVCPKCGSRDVYRGPVGLGAITAAMGDGTRLDTGVLSGINLTNYVCCGCGYVEKYVADPSQLKEVAAKYERVPGAPAK